MHRFLATAGLLGFGLVPSVSWAETINLTLRNGDSLQGELIERNPENGTTVLNHPSWDGWNSPQTNSNQPRPSPHGPARSRPV